MTKNVAVIAATGQIVNIKVCDADYVLQPYEVEVTDGASLNGDYVNGRFYAPKPFASWTRGEGTWLPPVPMPTDGKLYEWLEDSQEWQAKTD